MTYRKLPVLLALAVAMSCLAAAAQGRGRGRDNDHRFSDHDRDAVRVWVKDHHDHPAPGFREQDRLSPVLESQLRVGFVLDRGWRARMRPVPRALLVELEPAPRGWRYEVIDDHICLVDHDYRVQDVLHLEIDF